MTHFRISPYCFPQPPINTCPLLNKEDTSDPNPPQKMIKIQKVHCCCFPVFVKTVIFLPAKSLLFKTNLPIDNVVDMLNETSPDTYPPFDTENLTFIKPLNPQKKDMLLYYVIVPNDPSIDLKILKAIDYRLNNLYLSFIKENKSDQDIWMPL